MNSLPLQLEADAGFRGLVSAFVATVTGSTEKPNISSAQLVFLCFLVCIFHLLAPLATHTWLRVWKTEGVQASGQPDMSESHTAFPGLFSWEAGRWVPTGRAGGVKGCRIGVLLGLRSLVNE